MTSVDSCSAIQRIHELRRVRQNPPPPEVEQILERLAKADLSALLLVLAHPECVRDVPRVAAWLGQHLEELNREQADRLAFKLAECQTEQEYAALVARALGGADPASPAVEPFVFWLRGSEAFNRIVRAESQIPSELRAGRYIALELAIADLHRDDPARSLWLLEQARESPSAGFYIWYAAVIAGDDATAGEMLPALAQLPLFPSGYDTVETWMLRGFQLKAIVQWATNPGGPASRAEWLFDAVNAAHACGSALEDITRALLWVNAPTELVNRLRGAWMATT